MLRRAPQGKPGGPRPPPGAPPSQPAHQPRARCHIVAATPKGGGEAGWLAPGAQATHHTRGSLTAGAWAGRPSPPLPSSGGTWGARSLGPQPVLGQRVEALSTRACCPQGHRARKAAVWRLLSRPVDSSQKPRRRRRPTPAPACPSPQPTCPGPATPAPSWQGPVYPVPGAPGVAVTGCWGAGPLGAARGSPCGPPQLRQQVSNPAAGCLRCGGALLKLSPAKPDRLLLINPFFVNAR